MSIWLDPAAFGPQRFAAYEYPREIDPDLARVLAKLAADRAAGQVPDRYRVPFTEARRLLVQERMAHHEALPAMAGLREETLLSEGRTVDLRWYLPFGQESGPPIVYLHGGGWCVGSNDTHDTVLRQLAESSKRAVCGVDYSLAPEHPFPAALSDVRAVVDHVLHHAREAEAGSIVLAGDSAGANLALAEAMRRRDEGKESIRAIGKLLLFYGVYAPTRPAGSAAAYGSGEFGLTRQAQQRYFEAYAAGHEADPRVFPLLGDVSGLSPAWLLAAGLDMLLDDSVHLHHTLQAVGSESTLQVARGATHGYLNHAQAYRPAAQALAVAGRWAAGR